MLHQDLHAIDASPLGRWGPWLSAMLAAGAGLTIAIVLILVRQPALALAVLTVAVVVAASLRFPAPARLDPLDERVRWRAAGSGDRLASAGVLVAGLDHDGCVAAANGLFT